MGVHILKSKHMMKVLESLKHDTATLLTQHNQIKIYIYNIPMIIISAAYNSEKYKRLSVSCKYLSKM